VEETTGYRSDLCMASSLLAIAILFQKVLVKGLIERVPTPLPSLYAREGR
jgi:hypothetical protein